MGSACASVQTRRSLLALLCGAVGAAITVRAFAEEEKVATADIHPRKISEVRKEFERLLPLWKEEKIRYSASSIPSYYWKGPHGKAIIALGPAVIPYLIQQLKAGDFFFNVPLSLITRMDISDGKPDGEQAYSKLWIQWWDAANQPPG